ncbi:MAG: ABC transporter ATP-binding protein [Thermoplasmata archaeon]
MVQTPLVVDELSKVYRERKGKGVTAVDNVSFKVEEGEVVGLLGPNGAGKTTTIKCICGLINPTDGRIRVFGHTMDKPRLVAENVSAVLEGNRNIYWRLTAKENLEFFAGLQGIPTTKAKSEISRLLEMFDLEEKKDVTARKLSRGMQQKLALGCALIRQTPLLLLDEPTLGLDVEASIDMRKFILDLAREKGKTILLSSHDMKVVEDVCERVLVINHGQLIVDDDIRKLKRLFKVQSYEISVRGRIDERHLQDKFEELSVEEKDGHSIISAHLSSSESVYRLMKVLRENHAEIEQIRSLEPGFEEIFLKVLRRHK